MGLTPRAIVNRYPLRVFVAPLVAVWLLGSCGEDGTGPLGAEGGGAGTGANAGDAGEPGETGGTNTGGSAGTGSGGDPSGGESQGGSSTGGSSMGGEAGETGGSAGDAGDGGAPGGAAGSAGAGAGGAAGSAGAGAGGAGMSAGGMSGSAGAAGMGGKAGAAGMAGAGGGGGSCGILGGAASITSTGQAGRLLLRGTLVTPADVFEGEVLVEGDTITCAAPSCASSPGASGATIVETRGLVFPGLIDTHNHVLYDVFDETDWTPAQAYTNHNQWTSEARYVALVDAKQYLNSEGTSPVDFGCELDKYGEIKGLVAGTTSMVGAANPARNCYGTLARTIDAGANGLGADKIQVATIFPSASSADGVCNNFADDSTDAYLIHIGEGTDVNARNEFTTLGTVTTTDGCLYAPETALVHGIALGDAEFTTMAAHQMSLVWSPRSDIFLYGAGTDNTKTANIPLVRSKGINIALAPDWSIGGSSNLLEELAFAQKVDAGSWGGSLSAKALVEMVTTNAARALGLGNVLGSLTAGKKADLVVIAGNACAPYDALLGATPADVRLVLVGGVALYGDPTLATLGPATPGCETLNVCSRSKFICVAAPSLTATDRFGQTLATISSTLESALEAYDALDLSPWDFAPIAPIVKCQ